MIDDAPGETPWGLFIEVVIMKFKRLFDDEIVEVTNEDVIKSLLKDPRFEEVKDAKPKSNKRVKADDGE